MFTERDSDYRGVYHLATSLNGRIEIQPNAIPGDGSRGVCSFVLVVTALAVTTGRERRIR
ncbi:hypothetical protein [Streptomyces sp. NBC_00005]|uniref:hypothetical protein n=1 Tax=Streptomyces sp. NBC_00005 TaxID=2903609 RepID=UPI0032481183